MGQAFKLEEANRTCSMQVKATDLVLLDRLECRAFRLPFGVVATDNPALASDDIEPFVVWHVVRESLSLVRPHLKWASQHFERFWELLSKAPVKIQS